MLYIYIHINTYIEDKHSRFPNAEANTPANQNLCKKASDRTKKLPSNDKSPSDTNKHNKHTDHTEHPPSNNTMRPSQYLFNAAKKSSGVAIPVELTPLFVVMSLAVCSATFFTYKKFAHDKSLRLSRNPAQSHEDVKELLKTEK